jgi:hypothetical protein
MRVAEFAHRASPKCDGSQLSFRVLSCDFVDRMARFVKNDPRTLTKNTNIHNENSRFHRHGLYSTRMRRGGFAAFAAGMNGYSESQATPSLILYLVVGLGSAVGLGFLSGFVAKRLVERRSMGAFAASAITVVSASVIGVLILIAASFAAVALAEVLRGMR